jgi:hypothetical protein
VRFISFEQKRTRSVLVFIHNTNCLGVSQRFSPQERFFLRHLFRIAPAKSVLLRRSVSFCIASRVQKGRPDSEQLFQLAYPRQQGAWFCG